MQSAIALWRVLGAIGGDGASLRRATQTNETAKMLNGEAGIVLKGRSIAGQVEIAGAPVNSHRACFHRGSDAQRLDEIRENLRADRVESARELALKKLKNGYLREKSNPPLTGTSNIE